MLRSFIKKNQREGVNMETILFSKTDKIKIVTFVAVAFGLPWITVTADTGRGDFGVQYTGAVHDDSSDFRYYIGKNYL